MNRQDLQNLAEAYSQISEKKKDDSYLETDMKKRQENNEKARKDMEKMGTKMKNPTSSSTLSLTLIRRVTPKHIRTLKQV